MDSKTLEQALQAIASTNLGLQNALGTYAAQATKAFDIWKGEPHREARLARLEANQAELGRCISLVLTELKALKKRIPRKKK